VGSIGGYIVRTTLGAFLLVLVSLTALIWIAHALRDIDLVTNKGQTVLMFIGITGLLVPTLVMVIAPIALMIATAYTLNKLNTDSEIIVMNASGMSPWRIFLPFFAVAMIAATLIAVLSAYISPKSLRELRLVLTRVKADVVANIIQPGRFTNFEGGRLTFHVRERRPNGELLGLFIDDRRDPNERATFLAEVGRIVDNDAGSFLVLERGSAHRLSAKERDPAIVQFQRYAFDLSQFAAPGETPTFNVSERYLWTLFSPDPNEPYYQQFRGRFWAELHDRLVAPFYPLVFCAIVFALLGAPRTSRQSRGVTLIMGVMAVAVLRLLGFGVVVFSIKNSWAPILLYSLLGSVFLAALFLISRGTIIEPPAFLIDAMAALQKRFMRRQEQLAPA
jgi:lipopolysaccharide export system permease protein